MPLAVRLRHVHKARHRDGRARYLLRLPGCRAVTLPGDPGTPAFMAAYHAAIANAAPPAARDAPGSLDALAAAYYRSTAFAELRASTQAAYRRLVEELRSGYGARPIRLLEPRHIEDMLRAKHAHPTAANHRLRLLRALMAHALRLGWIKRDPTIGVSRMAYRTDGYHTWTEAEIAAFEARWQPGTRERLAFALLLYTGQRRSDVVRMGRAHLRQVAVDARQVQVIEVAQVKTGRRLMIPVHAALRWHDKATPAVVELPRKPPPMEHHLTRDQYAALLAAATTPHVRLFVILALGTAGRMGAILELTWDRVDFDRGVIRLGTGERRRKGRAAVPMTDRARAALAEAAKARTCDHVIEYGGKPVGKIRKAFAAAADAAGLPWCTPHVLRHTAAVWMAEAGVPMPEIAQYLGHEDDRITQRIYARFSPQHLRRAAGALE